MVDPATAAMAAKATTDLLKGMFGAIAAKKRAAYVGKQLDEQSKMLSIQWNRKITESVGQIVGGLGDRGLNFSGSVMDLALDTAFDGTLQKQSQKRQLEAEKQKALALGSEAALAALGKGVGDATGTYAEYQVKQAEDKK
jgi:hypothetical protein